MCYIGLVLLCYIGLVLMCYIGLVLMCYIGLVLLYCDCTREETFMNIGYDHLGQVRGGPRLVTP